jgi:hypothetical protein
MDEWMQLQEAVRGTVVNQEEDTILSGLTPSKQFTTSSLHRFLTTGGVNSRMAKKIWKSKIPLKIRVFLWQVFENCAAIEGKKLEGEHQVFVVWVNGGY